MSNGALGNVWLYKFNGNQQMDTWQRLAITLVKKLGNEHSFHICYIDIDIDIDIKTAKTIQLTKYKHCKPVFW